VSGLSGAYYYRKAIGGSRHCLILENHAMFGGHGKQNEFLVDGHRLTGPQTSNNFGMSRQSSGGQMDELFA
jgi:spermidine dehydrogenase